MHAKVTLQPGDALIVTDVQNDFLPGGALAVPHGDAVIAPLNRYIALFAAHKLPVIATRDWHPPGHCSFKEQGGPWPAHCIAGTSGAAFAENLHLPSDAIVVSKATEQDRDAYSAFSGTELGSRLKNMGVTRLFIGGLATDYCVLNSVLDALALGFQVKLLTDASRPVNVQPDDGTLAEQKMLAAGAEAMALDNVSGR